MLSCFFLYRKWPGSLVNGGKALLYKNSIYHQHDLKKTEIPKTIPWRTCVFQANSRETNNEICLEWTGEISLFKKIAVTSSRKATI
jgi:hypothetical protein